MIALSRIAECLKNLGYKTLTDLQKKSLQKVLSEDKSVIIVAPTGSGKTEAAVFPVMLNIAYKNLDPIAAIYVTPLRALNRDIASRLEKIGKCFEINVAVRHGDTPQRLRKLMQESAPHIIVTTPETFNYIVLNDTLRRKLANLKYIVIDEFRELLESKRGLLLLVNIYFLENYFNKRFTKIALTATLSEDLEEYVKKLLEPRGGDVVVLRDKSVREMELKVVVPDCVTDLCKAISNELNSTNLASHVEVLVNAAKEHKHILVFTNTRSLAERLGSLLSSISSKLGLNVSFDVHHGSLSKTHREKVEKMFKQRALNGIVATSSLELGIDIGHVNLVVQYMSPRQATRLVQRVGRSHHRLGEASKGLVISARNILHRLECGVLAVKAKQGYVEKEVIIKSPLDVLAFVLALFVEISGGGVNLNELYALISGHPLYAELSFEDFKEVVDYLVHTRVLKVTNDSKLYPTRKTRLYLYKVSMIPSSRDVTVVTFDKEERVGSLDEEYVVVYLNPDDYIVLAGRLWRIIGYDDDVAKLYVEPAKVSVDLAVIPHWEGENIPVEYEVAQSVGAAIRFIKQHGVFPPDISEVLQNTEIPSYIRYMGDDKKIYIDYVLRHRLVIINVFGGTRLNNLIKDLLKYLVRNASPLLKFQVHSTPYTVVLEFKNYIPVEFVQNVVLEAFRNISKYAEKDVLEKIARESTACLWRIYQVAQRFGAISVESTKVSRKLLEAFIDTVIGKEAIKEVVSRDYDYEALDKLAKAIERGEVSIEFRVYDKLEEHHAALLELDYSEVQRLPGILTFDKQSYYDKLINRRVSLLCIRCGYLREGRVKEFLGMESYACPKCGFATLTVVKGDATKELEILEKEKRGEKLSPEERRIREDLSKRAILLYRYGEKALLALAGRGVSTQEAIRIINKALNGSDIIAEVAEVERRFLTVKKYLTSKVRDKDEE